MRDFIVRTTLALSFALAGCQSAPTKVDTQAERQDLVAKTTGLTADFMTQADLLERTALRMYDAIKSPTDDVSDEDCAFVADEKNREMPLVVFKNLAKLREMRGLLGLIETKEESVRYRDMRDSMEWSYGQFLRTYAYCNT